MCHLIPAVVPMCRALRCSFVPSFIQSHIYFRQHVPKDHKTCTDTDTDAKDGPACTDTAGLYVQTFYVSSGEQACSQLRRACITLVSTFHTLRRRFISPVAALEWRTVQRGFGRSERTSLRRLQQVEDSTV